jgi:hypothetical protein
MEAWLHSLTCGVDGRGSSATTICYGCCAWSVWAHGGKGPKSCLLRLPMEAGGTIDMNSFSAIFSTANDSAKVCGRLEAAMLESFRTGKPRGAITIQNT